MEKMEVDFKNSEDQTLIIQHDWHLALKEPISSFFLGIRKPEHDTTIFLDVQVTKLIDEFGFTVLPSKDGSDYTGDFSNISLDLVNNLSVTYLGNTTIFVAPVAELRIAGLSTAPHSLDVSTSGQTFVSSDSSGNFVISTAMDGTTLRILEGHIMDVYKCQYFPSGLVVLSGGMDLTLKIWAVDTGTCVRTLKGHTQAITGIGIIGEGKDVISCSNDGTAKLWNCGSSNILDNWEFESGRCIALALNPSSSRFAVISERNLLSVIDISGKKTRKDISLHSEPTCVVFDNSESSNTIFVGFENGTVSAFSISQKSCIAEIKSNRGRVTCIKFHLNRLIIAYNDGRISAYSVPTMDKFASGDAPPVSFAEYEMTGADCDPIYDMATHGRTLYTCCRDKIIRKYKLLWEM